MKKYEFTGETQRSLKRIRALKDFGDVKAGDLGGWISSENNLSHDGNAWVYGNAEVYGNAWVSGNARVSGYASVYGSARVYGSAWVYGNAWVSGNARVSGIIRSDGYCFCYLPDDNGVFHVIAGCRYLTMQEAREHWIKTRGGTRLGEETMCILDAIEALHKVKPEGCV